MSDNNQWNEVLETIKKDPSALKDVPVEYKSAQEIVLEAIKAFCGGNSL